jgi:hypothetical protein
MKNLDTMTKAQLVELVAARDAQLAAARAGLFTLNAGKATRERKAGKITFNVDEIVVEQTDGRTATFNLASFFSHRDVMAHLLQYAIVRASTDSTHEQGMIGFMEAWAKGYTSPAEYERSLKPIEVKVSKAATTARTPNIGGLTDAETIAVIESLGGEFEAKAATLMTVQPAMFNPAVKFLADKYPEVAAALRAKVEAKKQAAIAAEQAALASIFG